MYYGSEKETLNAGKLMREFINTKYTLMIIYVFRNKKGNQMFYIFDQSLLADGHSPATYYVISDNIRGE